MYPVGYDVNSFVTPAGERYKVEYIGDVQENGAISLHETGKIDLWALHSAGAEACDINNIVERFRDGDLTVLNRVQGSFVDLCGMPSDLRGMSDMIHNLEHSYNELPAEVKVKYPDFNSWVSASGSVEWFNVMNSKSVESEVSENAES